MARAISWIVFLVIIWEVSSIQIYPGFKNYLNPHYYPQEPYRSVYQPPQRYADIPPQFYSPQALPPPVNTPPEPAKSSETSNPATAPSPILEALNTSLISDSSGKIDSAVLNNLAIALQLLIVNNLLHSKEAQNATLAEEIETSTPPTVVPPSVPYETPSSDHYAYSPYEHKSNHLQLPPQLPDAKFIGNSNFADCSNSIFSGPFVPTHTPRPGLHLKSPYEILATPPSPFDKYTPNYKCDFQSPYAAMLNPETSYTNDLFSF